MFTVPAHLRVAAIPVTWIDKDPAGVLFNTVTAHVARAASNDLMSDVKGEIAVAVPGLPVA